MSAYQVYVFCAIVLTAQSALSQCTSRAAVADPGLISSGVAAPYGIGANALAYGGIGAPLAYDGLYGSAGRNLPYDGIYPAMAQALDFTPTSGGGLPVTSASAIPPTGISLVSENVFEGPLAVAGEVPFVGTAAMEGVVPSAGAGAINHACGNGVNAMVSETTAFVPEYAAVAPAAAAASIAPAAAIAPGAFTAPGLGYRAGWAGCAL